MYKTVSVVSITSILVITIISIVSAQEEDKFKQCLLTRPSGSLGYCLGVGAISKLENWDNNPEFDIVDGVTFTKDEQQYREAYNYIDRDPSDLRTILDTTNHVFSNRHMKWDMEFLYPGLSMQVSPSLTPGGTLEFAIDPHREVISQQTLKESSTGQLIARSFVLPFLLGLKFNMVTLIPIIFGVIALLAKKALIISKLALIVSSAWGLGTLLFNNNKYNYHQSNGYYTNTLNPAFGGHHHYQSYRQADGDTYTDVRYKVNDNNYEDQIRLHGDIKFKDVQGRDNDKKGRNFAWEVKESTSNA